MITWKWKYKVWNLLAGKSVLNVDTHEWANEVFRLFADIVPVGRVKLELSWGKREEWQIQSQSLPTFENLSE